MTPEQRMREAQRKVVLQALDDLNGRATVQEIADNTPYARSTVLYLLRRLQGVDVEREGRSEWRLL